MRRALLALCFVGCAAARRPIVRAGAVGASAFVGFGAGQTLEGRWASSGWKFAVADSAFIAGYVYGVRGLGCLSTTRATDCDELAYTTLWIGALGLIGSHLVQVLHD